MASSQPNVIHENESARIYWDGDQRTLELEAFPCTSSEHIRSNLERTLLLVKEKRALKLLVRMPHMSDLEAEGFLQAHPHWIPRLLEEGIKYFAMVAPGRGNSLVDGVETATGAPRRRTRKTPTRASGSADGARQWLQGH